MAPIGSCLRSMVKRKAGSKGWKCHKFYPITPQSRSIQVTWMMFGWFSQVVEFNSYEPKRMILYYLRPWCCLPLALESWAGSPQTLTWKKSKVRVLRSFWRNGLGPCTRFGRCRSWWWWWKTRPTPSLDLKSRWRSADCADKLSELDSANKETSKECQKLYLKQN